MRYQVTGGNTYLMPESISDINTELQAKTYVVKFDQMGPGYFLQGVAHMKMPEKIYGDTLKVSERIIETFFSRPEQTGVHLTGEKGSGKTLLTKLLSMKLRVEHDLPTIIVNTPFAGEAFNTFVASIDTPCMFVFDEYEKMYDEDVQETMLTLFDGTRNSKKLFVVTTNDAGRVGVHMHNRPGRFFYKIKYEGLTAEFIIEYLNDRLNNKDIVEQTRTFCLSFGNKFNFDMLQALVEEMNRYNETASTAARYLNIEPASGKELYVVRKFIPDDPDIDRKKMVLPKQIWINPFGGFSFDFQVSVEGENDVDYYTSSFLPKHICKINHTEFHFKNDDGDELIVDRKPQEKFDYLDLLM